ncbi:gas vesicle protein [Dyadobacter jejuensis]|uniref:Gas vesicle protein n=1 Tax=Dyadobacter jejuensis TaxID=1082580 RepID=A0A316ANZ2_9BACT|nr:YtxH domain-containing protein [Dyadobacter jejuensis]PWJ59272.1 gas vesicle protein [Dyadobacter jejuensis]
MKNSKALIGIISAAVVGAVIGMLCAPEDGDKTRKKLKKKTNDLASELLDALEKSKAKAMEKVDELKSKGEAYVHKTEKSAEDLKSVKQDVEML